MWKEEQYLSLMLNFTSCTFLIAGVLLWLRHRSGDRARTYLALVCLFSSLCFLVRLSGHYAVMPVASSVLPIHNLIGGSLAMITLCIYPIEVISPGWFSLRRTIIMCAPSLVILMVTAFVPVQFRHLSSFGEIFQYAGEMNVWSRLLILLVIQLYVIWIFVIPRNWKKSSVSNRWIRFYSSMIICMGMLYGLYMLTGFAVISFFHLLFCLVFCLLIAYQELFLRIEVPVEPQTVFVSELVMKTTSEDSKDVHPLWFRLNELMREKELWKNPDITQEHLASLLGISRPTLSAVIRENGFSGYKEYLNRWRIENFLKILNSDHKIGIRDAFFTVGYRSRTTALQYFCEYLGCTPSEYLNRRSGGKTEC